MKISISIMAVVCLLAPVLGAEEGPSGSQSVRIADFVNVDLAFESVTDNNTHTITAPGASFIKIHFAFFRLPDNAYLEVRNPQGTEVYTYGMSARDGFTYDQELGEDGWDAFASMSITGDTAVVTLYGSDAYWGVEHGVYINRYMEGYPNGVIESLTGEPLWDDGASNRSTCGANERTPVECYSASYPTEYARAKAVARLVFGGGLCTAWRVSDSNRMFTNNHCVSSNSAVASSESWFNYQYTSCSSTSTTTPTKVSGNSMLETNSNLDFTLYTVNNFSTITSFGNLGLDVRTATLNEEIYIPQHGSGNPKELAITDDQNSTGICRVDAVIQGNDTAYYCDTIGGSSGSPVLARATHKAIALHHFGGCLNSGVRIALIWPEVSEHFGGVIPNGSGGGNQPPIAGFTSTTNLLTVSFSDTSTDSDGSIVGWSWTFGDGGTSSLRNPTHTYSSNGTYPVTLTATDNEGASGAQSASVTVSDGNPNGTELTSGVAVSGVGESTGAWVRFYIQVPAGASNLTVTTTGSDPDADLYVRLGAEPTTSTSDCSSTSSSSNESCSTTNPGAGTWYIGVYAYSNFAGLTITATVSTVGNEAPVAGFSSTTSGLVANFNDSSTDSDGTVDSWAWAFGDGGTSTSQNPSHTYATNGTYAVSLTVTDNDGATDSLTANVTVTSTTGNALQNGVPVSGLAANTGQWLQYYIDTSDGPGELNVTTSGSDADADLYVRFGAEPTTADYDCRSYSSSSNESCTISNPSGGRWYVGVYSYSNFTNLTLTATHSTLGCTPYDDTADSLSNSQGGWVYYTVEVPACASNLSVAINGGSGDADLYVRKGAPPTQSDYDCRPYVSGNNETCTPTPSAGTYHIGIRAYRAYSGVSLSVHYD